MRCLRSIAAGALAAAGVLALPAPAASAHPLGNFTINTYSGLRVADGHVSLDFLVDMAEIPTLQRRHDLDADGNGTVSGTERAAYAGRECPLLLRHLDVRLDGRALVLRQESADVSLAAGQAGLSTLRLSCGAGAATGTRGGEHRLSFASTNFTDRAGWREITAVGDGTTLVASDVPAESVSGRLASYPADLLTSPLDQRTASLVVRPGGPGTTAGGGAPSPAVSASPLPRGVDRATQAFTAFVAHQRLTLGFAALAVLASLGLGAIHALAPGHGKTVMAAYLVGQRGSFRQAMVIAATVTATHTAGVLALGIAISASAIVAPERLYPWLGAAGGVLLAALGIGFLVRIRRARGGAHSHDHPHRHDHPHPHDHPHRHDHSPGEGLVTRRGLVAMGFVGGLLPSPSAVVVLLGAIALGRAWFGVLLVVAYGLGMAATLAAAGLVLLKARGALDRLTGGLRERRFLLAATRLLPPATAVFISLAGCYLAVQGATRI